MPIMHEEFHQDPTVQLLGWGMLLLALPIVALLVVGLVQGAPREAPGVFAGLLLVAAVTVLSAAYLLARFSGRFVVDEEAITWERFGRATRLPYAGVVFIEERYSPLVPYLLLQGRQARLRISSKVVDFPRLQGLLERRLAHLARPQAAWPPLELRILPRFYRRNGFLFLALLALLGALLVAFAGGAPGAGAGVLAALFLSGAALLLLAFVLFELRPPLRLRLTAEMIESYGLLGRRRQWPAASVRDVRWQRAARSYRGIREVVYPVTITFADGSSLTIPERRIWSFGYSPRWLYAVLRRFYQPSD